MEHCRLTGVGRSGDGGSPEGVRPAEMQRQSPADVLIEDLEDPGAAFDALEAFSRITGGARTQLPPYPTLRSPVSTAGLPAAGILQPNGVHVEEEAGTNADAR